MYLKYISLTFLLVATVASYSQPCCWDMQYEATITEFGEARDSVTGRIGEREGGMRYYSDYLNRRYAAVYNLHQESGNDVNGRSIADYNTEKVYTISLDSSNCTVADMKYPVMRKHCIPDNATYLGSATFGDGNNKLMFHSWYFEVYTYGIKTGVHFDVSSDGCVPVMETRQYTDSGNVAEIALEFRDYKEGVSDTSVYDIPPSCFQSSS